MKIDLQYAANRERLSSFDGSGSDNCGRRGCAMISWLRQLLLRFASLFRRTRRDQDLDVELAAHLELALNENLKNGMTPAEARRQALVQFGGIEQTKELVRDTRGLPLVDEFLQDFRFSLRVLRKSPVFTVIAVLTLALGVGATTSIFSVAYGVLLRPLPYHHPEQIVQLWEVNATGGNMHFADPNFADLRSQNHCLQAVAQYSEDLQSVSGGSEPTRTRISSVSKDFFSVMDVQPVLGRGFAPEEQIVDAPLAALVSQAYWEHSLGGARDLSSIHLKIGARSASVIGVLPAAFRFPDKSDIWIPREIYPSLPSRTAHNSLVVGRLREGNSVKASQSELSQIAVRLKQQYGEDTAMVDFAVEPLREAMTSNMRPALIILLGAAGFLLVIACANVVNLMLAQAAGRERELSIRVALGVRRNRLIRQFLTEAFVLSLTGGALGVLFTLWSIDGLLAIAPSNFARLEDVSVNLPVLLFSLMVVLLVAITLGLFSAIRATLGDPRATLKEGSQRQTGTVTEQRLGRLLVTTQLAITLVLLVGAGLLGRSLLKVLSVDPGFHVDNVLTMDIGLPDDPTKFQRIQFLDELLQRLQQVPGVEEIGGTNVLPLSGTGRADGAYVLMNPAQISPMTQDLFRRIIGGSLQQDPVLLAEFSKFFDNIFKDKSHLGEADYCVASDRFFTALGIPLRSGRYFDARDTIDAPHVAIISQSLADEKWPNQDPLGHSLEFGNMDGDPRLLTVVGVVGDIRDRSLEAPARPAIYVNFRQRPQAAESFIIVMRASGKPESINSAAREILRALDPNIPPRFGSLSQTFAASVDARRFSLTLVGIFSGAALLLAIAGIYGVTSYSVTRRTREIGVRMALGATAREVLVLVLGQGALTSAAGIAIGIVGSLIMTRWLQSQLFGVSPADPATFIAVALLLTLVTLAACGIPARRATKVDPIIALRYE